MKIRQLAALILLFSITWSVYGMESGKPDIPKEADEQLPIGQNTLGLPDVLLNSFPIQQVILKHYQFSYPNLVAQVLSHMPISPTTSLKGHTEAALSVAFSPDGKTLASGEASSCNNINLWDLKSGLCIKTLSDDCWVTEIQFSLDGKTLISGTNTSDTLWNIDPQLTPNSNAYGAFIKRIWNGNKPSIYFSAFHPNRKIAAFRPNLHLQNKYWSKTIELNNFDSNNNTFTAFKILSSHDCYDTIAVAFSPDGKTLASGGTDNTIKLWNVDPQLDPQSNTYGKYIKTLFKDNDEIKRLIFSPNGKIIAAICRKSIKLLDLDSGTCISALQGQYNDVTFSPNGMALATGSNNATINLWDLTPLYKMKEYLESRIPLKAKILLWHISQTKSQNKRLYLNKVNKKIFKSLHPIVQTALQNDVEFSKKRHVMHSIARALHIKH